MISMYYSSVFIGHAYVIHLVEIQPCERTEKSQPGARGGILHLFLNKQPCHHSSDTAQQSCTRDLCEFYVKNLKPLDISLQVAIGYTYRAHWNVDNLEGDREKQRYGPAITSAREGLKMFSNFSQGVVIRCIYPVEWDWLVGLCDPLVQQDWRRSSADSPFTTQHRKSRSLMDDFVQQVIMKHGRCTSCTSSGPDSNGVRSQNAGSERREPATFAERMREKRRLRGIA
eukprot:799817-Prorocentrum_minimum.AAC.1